MLIRIKTGGVWENKGKVEKWEFVKSHDFIKYVILQLKYCHMIMTCANHPTHQQQQLWCPLILHPSSPHYHHHSMNGNGNNRCNNPNTQQPAYKLCHTIWPKRHLLLFEPQVSFVFFSLLFLFYGLTNYFYLSFRLPQHFNPKMAHRMPSCPPHPSPLLWAPVSRADNGVTIRQQCHAGEMLGGLCSEVPTRYAPQPCTPTSWHWPLTRHNEDRGQPSMPSHAKNDHQCHQ
jgi:hypothetical protein